MSVQVTPHPAWVADLDAALDPSREAILDTPVIVHASENELVNGKIQNFLVAFYPIIRDFPQWLQLLLGGSPKTRRSDRAGGGGSRSTPSTTTNIPFTRSKSSRAA